MIGNNEICVLIDTGSLVSLIKESGYKSLDCPALKTVKQLCFWESD